MTLSQAVNMVLDLQNQGASRSKVCSFINQLASSKLIEEAEADYLCDILEMARENSGPVLRMISTKLSK